LKIQRGPRPPLPSAADAHGDHKFKIVWISEITAEKFAFMIESSLMPYSDRGPVKPKYFRLLGNDKPLEEYGFC